MLRRIKLLTIILSLLSTLELAYANDDFDESTFNIMMNAFGNGKIPYPFKNLLDTLEENGSENSNILAVPKGRSLVKNQANFENPRFIVDPVGNPGAAESNKKQLVEKMGIRKGDLYVGYVAGTTALEVISFNQKTNKYDFFIIEDYAEGKTPKVVEKKALCVSCHQNEGPIFPRFPWSEMLGHTAQKILTPSGALKSSGENELVDRIVAVNPARSEIEGISLTKNKGRFDSFKVVNFDVSIRDSNERLTNAKMCNAVCSENSNELACKKKLFEYAFLTYDVLNPSSKAKMDSLAREIELSYLSRLAARIDKVKIKSDLIPNREVEKTQLSDAENPATPRGELEFLQNLKLAMKKKKRRELIDTITATCFKESEFKKFGSGKDLKTFMYDLNLASNENTIKSWPLNRDSFRKLISDYQPMRLCENGPKMTVLSGPEEKLLSVVKKVESEMVKKPVDYFQKYCLECHGPQGILTLPLDSLEGLAKYVPTMSSDNVLARLTKKIMPPAGAHLPLPDQERKEMINALKSFSK